MCPDELDRSDPAGRIADMSLVVHALDDVLGGAAARPEELVTAA